MPNAHSLRSIFARFGTAVFGRDAIRKDCVDRCSEGGEGIEETTQFKVVLPLCLSATFLSLGNPNSRTRYPSPRSTGVASVVSI